MAAEAKLGLVVPVEIDRTVDVTKPRVHIGSTVADETTGSIGTFLAVGHAGQAGEGAGIGVGPYGAAGDASSLVSIQTEGTSRRTNEIVEVVAGRT